MIRDLVVDIGDFMRKLPDGQAVDRSARTSSRVDEGEYLQTPAEMDDYKQFSMCINCMLCYSACPVVRPRPGVPRPGGHRAGPALQPRLARRGRRRAAATCSSTAEGIWGCTFVGECTTACPKGVDPAGAIQRYKLTAAMHSVKSLLLPRGAR